MSQHETIKNVIIGWRWTQHDSSSGEPIVVIKRGTNQSSRAPTIIVCVVFGGGGGVLRLNYFTDFISTRRV